MLRNSIAIGCLFILSCTVAGPSLGQSAPADPGILRLRAEYRGNPAAARMLLTTAQGRRVVHIPIDGFLDIPMPPLPAKLTYAWAGLLKDGDWTAQAELDIQPGDHNLVVHLEDQQHRVPLTVHLVDSAGKPRPNTTITGYTLEEGKPEFDVTLISDNAGLIHVNGVLGATCRLLFKWRTDGIWSDIFEVGKVPGGEVVMTIPSMDESHFALEFVVREGTKIRPATELRLLEIVQLGLMDATTPGLVYVNAHHSPNERVLPGDTCDPGKTYDLRYASDVTSKLDVPPSALHFTMGKAGERTQIELLPKGTLAAQHPAPPTGSRAEYLPKIALATLGTIVAALLGLLVLRKRAARRT